MFNAVRSNSCVVMANIVLDGVTAFVVPLEIRNSLPKERVLGRSWLFRIVPVL